MAAASRIRFASRIRDGAGSRIPSDPWVPLPLCPLRRALRRMTEGRGGRCEVSGRVSIPIRESRVYSTVPVVRCESGRGRRGRKEGLGLHV